jgi:hypothetical protein
MACSRAPVTALNSSTTRKAGRLVLRTLVQWPTSAIRMRNSASESPRFAMVGSDTMARSASPIAWVPSSWPAMAAARFATRIATSPSLGSAS